MTTLALHNVGKKYASGWVFRNLTGQFASGDRIAVTGYNGSGKSTLMRLIAGSLLPDEGTAVLTRDAGAVGPDDVFRYITMAAPYLDLVESFTPRELLAFYSKFKRPLSGDVGTLMIRSGLVAHAGKKVGELSSGLKQRLKLVLALCFQAEIILLDEPGTNLDDAGLSWLAELLESRAGDGILFIASNDPVREASSCLQTLCIEDFKQAG